MYSKASLLFLVSNHQALMAKYDFTIYDKLAGLASKMPQDARDKFQAPIDEGKLVMRLVLQTALDMNTMMRFTATAVMMGCLLWLSSEILKEVQMTVEDHLFQCGTLFSTMLNESFHSLKEFFTL